MIAISGKKAAYGTSLMLKTKQIVTKLWTHEDIENTKIVLPYFKNIKRGRTN